MLRQLTRSVVRSFRLPGRRPASSRGLGLEALEDRNAPSGLSEIELTWAPDSPEALSRPGFDLLLLDLAWPELNLARLREALASSPEAEPESLDAAERRHIAVTLRFTAGNKRRAAELLGIARSTLLHKVRKYGLSPE